jgi:hypothetical protein
MSDKRAQLPEGLLCADGFDEAIIGTAYRAGEEVVVYDRERCVEILSDEFADACVRENCRADNSECDHWSSAEEFLSYNTERASDYLGTRGPIFVSLLRDCADGLSAVKDQGPQRGDKCQDDDCYCVGADQALEKNK